MNEIINTCFETTKESHVIAYYSHLIPLAITLALAIFILIKTKLSRLSLTFIAFSLTFILWLAGDLVTWVNGNYFLVIASWSVLDFINAVFFIFGLYFFIVLTRGGKDVSIVTKLVLILPTIPIFIMTVTGYSVTSFDQIYCEAVESNLVTVYKLVIEAICLIALFVYTITGVLRQKEKLQRRAIALTGGSLFFFLGIFSVFEYIASITDYYEIHLYSMFSLPFFLIIITFVITTLNIIDLRLFRTQILSYILLILVAAQLLYISDMSEQLLGIITLVTTAAFAYMLNSNVGKQIAQQRQIETLAKDLKVANTHLEELSTQKSQFVSLATHQIRSPLTALQGYASLLLEGDYGQVSKEQKDAIAAMYESAHNLITIVGDYLDISRIDLGKMKYDMTEFSLRDLIASAVHDLQPNLLNKPITLTYTPKNPDDACPVRADMGKIKQMVGNIIDNAIKYTPQGTITVSLEHKAATRRYVVSIADTGVGIAPETKGKLFERFSRADDAHVVNTQGTGLGLFIVKQFAEAHGGRIWVESEGKEKGSQFYIDLPERAEDVK